MALIFMDGFDHYAIADLGKKWGQVTVGSQTTATIVAGRNGNALKLHKNEGSGGTYYATISKSFVAAATIVCGFAFKTSGGHDSKFLKIMDGATEHVNLNMVGVTGQLRLINGNGTTLATSGNALSANTWYYIETKVTIGDVGTYEVRVNGSSVGWIPSASGDTKYGANTSTNAIILNISEPDPDAFDFYFDDLYIVDCTTSGLNDFLGDVMVETVYPNGNGTYSDFTGSDGDSTDNYLLVDETSFNTTDYNSSTGIGQQDTYAFASLTTATSIKAVQLNNMLKKDDAATRTEQAICISGATTDYGATGYPGTDFLDMMTIWETDPNTAGQWTASDLNAAEFGVKVVG